MTNTNKGLIIAAIIIILLTKPKKGKAENIVNRMTDYSKYRWYKNIRTLNFLNKLHPKFRVPVALFFSEIEDKLNLTVYPTSGYRTFAEQAVLYKDNNKNAKAGYSDHNFGFAMDINIMDKNNNIILRKKDTVKKWKDSGVIGISENLGFKWGGNFVNYHDPVHFYIKPNDKTITQLRELVNNGKVDSNGYVLV